MNEWKNPPLTFPSLEFDFSICHDPTLQDLILLSSQESLPKSTQSEIITTIQASPSILDSFIDEKFSQGLLENNPLLIPKIMKLQSSNQIYISAILKTALKLQTMEIVKELLLNHIIDPEFIYIYLEEAMRKFNLKDFQKEQSARLLCVFVLNLINVGLIDKNRTGFILKSFCLEHSQLKEAIQLFALF
jgi:hypothetical protein